jgi:hypothetical protein
MGKLWPRYRPLFEAGADRRMFEWRAAVHPLWLAFPGLYRPVLGVIAGVLAGSVALSVFGGSLAPMWVLALAATQLVAWPAATVALLLAATARGTGALALFPLAAFAVSIAFGMRAPRWIVAEGRRRWRRQAARAAGGAAPGPPRAIFAPHPVVLAAVATVAGLGSWTVLIGFAPGEEERMHTVWMQSALRDLVALQEARYADSVRYMTAVPDSLMAAPGVTVRIITATDAGWSAVARSPGTSRTCSVFVGAVPSPIEGGREGEPTCTLER